MTPRTIVLRDGRDERGYRYLEARLNEEGDLVIQGQELGRAVKGFFGPGNSEYEWVTTVKAREVPQLLAALGGAPSDDLMALVERRCTGEEAIELEKMIRDRQIPHTFWNRVGD